MSSNTRRDVLVGWAVALAILATLSGPHTSRYLARRKRRRRILEEWDDRGVVGVLEAEVEGRWASRLRKATSLALRAGMAMLEAQEKSKSVSHKGQHDLVTDTDKSNEELIRKGLERSFPMDGFIGEEDSAEKGGVLALDDSVPSWIVDPIDGTTNFVHSFPVTCVSMGMAFEGKVQVGVVFNPCTGDLYQAVRGRGAYLNGKRIHASGATRLDGTMVVAEYSYLRGEDSIRIMMDTTRRILSRVRAIRQTGCGAMDLCYLARGAVDAVYGGVPGVWKPWDWAAGVLIAEEAGAEVLSGDGGDFELMGETLLCTSSPALASSLIDVVGPSFGVYHRQ